MVEQLADIERAPQKRLATEQTAIQERNNAFTGIKTGLNVFRSRITALKSSDLFDSRTALSSNATLATVSVSPGANIGRYAFSVSQMATTSSLQGTGNIGKRLSETNDVSALKISDAGFSTAVTAGVFTVNGSQVTLDTSDTLEGVFAKISTATGGTVTGSYDKDTDKITLAGTGSIVLGSATDTSNFLRISKLHSSDTGSAESADKLGAVRLSGTLQNSNLGVAITGDSNNKGLFKINGVEIAYDTDDDSMTNVIARINSSSAGVTASYDAVNDQFTLTNKSTGDTGIGMEDVSGNFLAATGLKAGALSVGKNLVYTVNGGGALSSQSNTITDDSSGLPNLSVAVLDKGDFTVSVGADTAKIRKSITDFVDAYNSVQAQINTQIVSTTDAKGKVQAGTLAADPEANELNSRLRTLMTATNSGLPGSITRLENFGFTTNGYDDAVGSTDLTRLDDALANNLSAVKDFFTNSAGGLATSLDAYMENTIGDAGSLVAHQNTLTQQSGTIDIQIADMEKFVLNNRQTMLDSFVAMETAQAKINNQLTFLNKTFNS